MGNHRQGEGRESSPRTLRRQTQWCWRVQPRIIGDGVVHPWVQLDGFYATGLCCLVIASESGIMGWQWCDREKQVSWAALIQQFPAPDAVVCDGQPGLLAAIRTWWPSTVVQRCLVHVLRDVRTYLTSNPRTPAGQGLLTIAKQLSHVTSIDQAAQWLISLNTWWQVFGHLTTEKTYRVNVSDHDVPSWARPTQQWWYTHKRLRSAWRLLHRLARQGDLFRFLELGMSVPPTTNRIEGGVNAQLRRLLGHHRGMPSAHQQRAIEWWLYLHSQTPIPPSTLIQPHHIHPPVKPPADTPDGPPLYGDGLNAEEGLWTRQGWAGRSLP